jgi:uncharacterized metal-binding protein YceD (DUF177 family)
MTESFAWRVPVTVSDLPPDGKEFELVPDESAREELARQAGVLAVPKLVARLNVRPEGRAGAAVDGTLEATVRQMCVVSLEPFDNPVQETVSLRFASPETLPVDTAPVVEVGGEDPPEPLVDGKLDLASVIGEFLTLSVDPYPRRPGAVFAPPGEDSAGKETSAFAALAKLKLDKNVKKQ